MRRTFGLATMVPEMYSVPFQFPGAKTGHTITGSWNLSRLLQIHQYSVRPRSGPCSDGHRGVLGRYAKNIRSCDDGSRTAWPSISVSGCKKQGIGDMCPYRAEHTDFDSKEGMRSHSFSTGDYLHAHSIVLSYRELAEPSPIWSWLQMSAVPVTGNNNDTVL